MIKRDKNAIIGFRWRYKTMWGGCKLGWHYPLIASTYFKNLSMTLFFIEYPRQVHLEPTLMPWMILTMFIFAIAMTG